MSPPANIAILAGTAGEVRPMPVPMPGPPEPGGLLVRMLFAPVNPADLLAIDGRYALTLDPGAPIGAEGIGMVEQAGEGVLDLRPGDLVLPLDRGNWTSWRRLDRARVMPVPPGVAPEQAAMLRINPATAWLLLDMSGAGPGDCIVQNAAHSAVAHWVRSFAAMRDITVIDVGRRGSAPSEIAAFPDDGDLAGAVRAAAASQPIRAALDCVAGSASGRLAACLEEDGVLLVFGHLSGEPASIPSTLLTGRGLTVRGFTLRRVEARMTPTTREAMAAAIAAAVAGGAADLPIQAVLPLAEADRAIALARTPGRGRVLLDLQAISGM
ncbi:MDR family NADPH-dependent oxidoreductase [Rhizorhabdus dicambivorans]|uniref:enoyl-[acyl-carrier-protein] reductase n=1 Tax=Rhizorhabdus dicambivorans TaxID=1850238 RepID=A0A2A4FVQ1_9SPHN|nr:2-enoyl thioester reductase domain-containing protein [Rhizorhabdus dicambivorans]ATE63923.1 alcohol dehydrogenase [Rhizorhabdus dicambivorans]PCE41528.1 alcohol dehydrogenase [Rhizorhabdus dicambivorans]